MAVEPQVHLRHVHQVLVDAMGPIGFAQALAVDHPAIGTGAAEARRLRGQPLTFQHMAAQR
ncbi:hypothetical protein D9M71_782950 [compost metagenome]